MLLFEHVQFGGRAYELFRDVYDATSFTLSGEFSARVVRGCWILYEKPGFEGRSLALEEGNIELANVWEADEAIPTSPMVIGSIRLAVSDYSPPLIALFTEPCGHGTHTQYHCETPELCMYGIPQNTGSIKVHSGVWLVYSEPMFQGLLAVLETGEYPTPDTWGFPSPAVGSVRPLCMGPLKVENPAETKALLYEQPGLQGPCVEIQGEVFDVRNGHTESTPSAHSHTDTRPLRTVGSMKILSGLWVGYEEVGFEGRQFVLEEGEYLDWTDWGGVSKQLLSVRPVLADFTSPRMKLFSAVDFGDVGASVDLLEAVVDTQNTGYGLTTNSIRVFSGVWVAFEKAGFSGQLYVLEKGLYEEPEDWGAENSNIGSTMPVVQVRTCCQNPTSAEKDGFLTNVPLAKWFLFLTLFLTFIHFVFNIHSFHWVNFRGSQTLLKPGEVSDWPKVSGWQQIGSLRPLMQRQVHFFLRNQESGLLLSVTGSWDDIKLLRVQAVAETGGLDQVWSYQNGHLLCKVRACVCVLVHAVFLLLGQVNLPHQVWSLTSEGFIRSNANPDLVLDIKGGQQYDRTHIILNTHHPSRQSQRWTVEIL
uniref:Beta/gamma crystallin 'Greek key' domain-containing protein n=1 Tax=Denticeps clupeoides TaxID=299321 RepID=A0AAY4CD68_9TELE